MHKTTHTSLVSQPKQDSSLSRRAIVAAPMLMLPRIAHAARTLTEWRLALRNVHTNETFYALFGRAGRYIPDGLAELNHGLRDWRTNEVTQMDRRLFIVLARLR